MLNELEEVKAYTEPPIYKADSKRDTTYLERFTMDMILDFNGLARVLTVLAPVCFLKKRLALLLESRLIPFTASFR